MVPEVRGEPCGFQLLGSLPWPARLLQMKGAFFFVLDAIKHFFFFLSGKNEADICMCL